MITKIQVRRSTAASWTSSNPRLAVGEFGYETDTGKLKIGNGTATWNALSYFAGSSSAATGGADSDWVIRTIKRLDLDSDWVLRQTPKVQTDSDWITRNFKERADSDWVIRTIKRLDVDSDWVTKQLYTKTQVDSDLYTKSKVANTFYVQTGVGNKFNTVVAQVGTLPVREIVFTAGGHNSGSTTTIDGAGNLSITGPSVPNGSPAVTIAEAVTITGAASTRVRFSNISFDGVVTIDGTVGRHVFKACSFNAGFVFAGSTTNFVTFEDCTFNGFTLPITFAGLIYHVRSAFSGVNPTLNQASAQQVICTDCSGFVSFPTNATLFANNALSTAYTRWTGNELRIGGKTINGNLDSDWVGRQVSAGGFTSGVQSSNLTFGGYHINEKFTTLTANPSGTTALDTAANSLFYVAGTSNAWAVNLTNVNIAIGESCAVTIICNNGATVNFPSSWAYNGTSITAKTLNGVVYSMNANKFDIINATLMRTATSTYFLTVSLSSYA